MTQSICPDFPNAIRRIEDLKIGSYYVKIYSHLDERSEPMKLIKINKDKIGTVLFFEGDQGYAADCGVIKYKNGRWNKSNYLIGYEGGKYERAKI